MIGIFPVTYVEIIPNESVGSLSRNNRTKEPVTSPEGKGKAKFNFQAQTPMELSLIKGKIRKCLKKLGSVRAKYKISE